MGGGGGVVRTPLRTPMYSSNQEAPTMMHERVQCAVRNDGILKIYIYSVYKGGGGGGSGQRGNNAGYATDS